MSRSRRRRGMLSLTLVLGVTVLLMIWAFSHSRSVSQTRSWIRDLEAGRRAEGLAANLIEQGPQLVQLAMNAESSVDIGEVDEQEQIPGKLRGLGLGQVLRIQIPPPEATYVANGVEVEVVEIRAKAEFLEVDPMMGPGPFGSGPGGQLLQGVGPPGTVPQTAQGGPSEPQDLPPGPDQPSSGPGDPQDGEGAEEGLPQQIDEEACRKFDAWRQKYPPGGG